MSAMSGTAAIIWQNAGGEVASWKFAGTNFTGKAVFESKGPNWKVLGSGDFNWDGRLDLVWMNEVTRRLEIALMDGVNVLSSDYVRAAPRAASGWNLLGVGDLNHDATADLLWSRPDGKMVLWEMDGTSFVKASWFHSGKVMSPNWRLAAIADMDGDTKNELIWQHLEGHLAVSQLNGSNIQTSTLLQSGKRFDAWKVAGASDFDGDNKTDFILRHKDGSLALWIMNGLHKEKSQLLRNGISVSHAWRIIGVQ